MLNLMLTTDTVFAIINRQSIKTQDLRVGFVRMLIWHFARVAELADAQDLKSCEVTLVPVRFRSRAHSKYAQIAQLVEQRTENPRVLGSIPSLGTLF